MLQVEWDKSLAAVMKLVDIGVSKSPAGNGVRVRVPPAALTHTQQLHLAYIVGVALGDGNLSRPNRRVTRLRITCDRKYPRMATEYVDSLKLLLPRNKVSIVERRDNCFDISVYSTSLDTWMPWRVGMGSKIQQSARVPLWIRGDAQYSVACLRGLIQTDGCLYVDRGYSMLAYTSNCRSLAKDVESMLLSLSFRPTATKIKNGSNDKYTIRIARKNEYTRAISLLNLYKA